MAVLFSLLARTRWRPRDDHRARVGARIGAWRRARVSRKIGVVAGIGVAATALIGFCGASGRWSDVTNERWTER